MLKYLVFLSLVAFGVTLPAFADELPASGPKIYRIVITEQTSQGSMVVGDRYVSVLCDQPADVSVRQDTTYLTNPAQPGPLMQFKGQIKTSNCSPVVAK